MQSAFPIPVYSRQQLHQAMQRTKHNAIFFKPFGPEFMPFDEKC